MRDGNPRLLLLGCLLLLSGCRPNLEAISARVIDCPEDDVRISDEDLAINNSSWTARCHGEPYRCHGQDSLITCKPAAGGAGRGMVVPPPPAASPPPTMH
jgi:hypothetical protein